MKKDCDQGSRRFDDPVILKRTDERKNRLTQALRANLKKRKFQAGARKIIKESLNKGDSIKE